MHHLNRLILLTISALLAQCTGIAPEQKAGIRKVVVSCQLKGPQLTRYKMGLTAFNNESAPTVPLADMKSAVLSLVQQEAQRFFPTIVMTDEAVNVETDIWVGKVKPNAQAARLAAKHGADAVLCIFIGGYTPYGYPPGAADSCFGAWYDTRLGHKGAAITCCARQRLFSKDGSKAIASGFSPGGANVAGIPFESEFSAYSADVQAQFRKACLEALRQSLQGSFGKMGYFAKP